ncbi:MAG TPA: glycoside hydrolase family 15 protein, partial [Dehalococcoidia bacterium]
MNDYPAIENHGLIGDLQTAALVSTEGTIDWLCLPRFDSPSVFASLLDREHGGHFSIKAIGDGVVTRQMYLPGTAIIVTRFMSADGVGEVVDFMPIAGEVATQRHRLVRLIRVVRGHMRFEFECVPRFEYGREEPAIESHPGGVTFRGSNMSLNLSVMTNWVQTGEAIQQVAGGRLLATRTLTEGEFAGIMIESQPDGPPQPISADGLMELFEQTRTFWRDWLAQSTYRGRWREAVERSAMTLKLMTYAPTGALVAAPTAGLPEQVGGERNWDYRFTWVRDASFSVYALLSLGYTEEARAFITWLKDRLAERNGNGDTPLQIMYRVDGSPDLHEEVLEHLAGYKDSRPVRIGNGAAGQMQLDIFGEALDSVYLGDQHRLPMS